MAKTISQNIPIFLSFLILAWLKPANSVAQVQHGLPESDFHYKATRSYIEETPIPEYRHASEQAYEDFRDIKYGVRIHWGIYSVANSAHESWPFLTMSLAERQKYQELYKTWNPAAFSADDWMKLFAENGVKMFAFTAKHHEGFSMFDTKTRVVRRANWIAPGGPKIEDCDLAYSIMESPLHRDVVKELCDAAHQRGIKIDLYFSHPDWYDADFRPYGWHPLQSAGSRDLPVDFGKTFEPKRFSQLVMMPDPDAAEQARMIARHRQQLEELLTNYGKIDMMCLDNWLGGRCWPEMRQTILKMRKLQPDVMLRARGIGNYGDYYTPEGFVPGSKENTDMPWFVIYPLARGFSYDEDAAQYKGGGWIISSLVDAAAKGGSFMVGIGPDAGGQFHPRAIENLKEAGAWLKVNGQSIYATRARAGDDWKQGDTIRFTRSKDAKTVYAISLKWPGAQLVLKSVKPAANSEISLLGSAQPLPWTYAADAGTTILLPAQPPLDAKSPLGFAYVFQIQVGPEGN
jgi:alpha-L-fucosidase